MRRQTICGWERAEWVVKAKVWMVWHFLISGFQLLFAVLLNCYCSTHTPLGSLCLRHCFVFRKSSVQRARKQSRKRWNFVFLFPSIVELMKSSQNLWDFHHGFEWNEARRCLVVCRPRSSAGFGWDFCLIFIPLSALKAECQVPQKKMVMLAFQVKHS
jgi:hypothetical protein